MATRLSRIYHPGETCSVHILYSKTSRVLINGIVLYTSTLVLSINSSGFQPDHLVDGPVLGVVVCSIIKEVASTPLPLLHLNKQLN